MFIINIKSDIQYKFLRTLGTFYNTGTRYIRLGQKLIPAKTQTSYRPVDLKLQNKFSPLIVVTFVYCLSNIFVSI